MAQVYANSVLPACESVGARLREVRKRTGLSQTRFAAIAGVTRGSQYNYECGENTPGCAYLAALAERGCDVGYVLTGHRKPHLRSIGGVWTVARRPRA